MVVRRVDGRSGVAHDSGGVRQIGGSVAHNWGMGHVGGRMVGSAVIGRHWSMGNVGWSVVGSAVVSGRSVVGGDWSMSHGNGGSDSLYNGGSERGLADDGVESVDGIGGVVDGATGAIGFGQGVLASHNIAIAGLVLVLVVTGDGVFHIIGEGILGMSVIIQGLKKRRRRRRRLEGIFGELNSFQSFLN